MLWSTSQIKPVAETFIVTILYKGGNKFVGRFEKFEYHNGNLSWIPAPNRKYPDKPLKIGVDDIAAVWYHAE